MDQPLAHSSGATRSAPEGNAGSQRESTFPERLSRFVPFLLLLAAFSTAAGFLVGGFQARLANSLNSSSLQASVASNSQPVLAPASDPRSKKGNIEEINHLAPQQQAERLLELAIQRPDQSLDLIYRNLDSWRGHVQDTDHLFHLVLAALDSEDPRVRIAAVEIDLAANNLIKSPQSVAKLLRQIHSDPLSRYLALWRLGALGNRGVEPVTVLATLLRYAHDPHQQTRFWAVEGLAMLGTDESIDPLLSILAHDPAMRIRERAAVCLARSGLLEGEQRLTAVPQLLNLLDDDSLDSATQGLVYAALQAITGASFGKDPQAWREWWAHHDGPKKRPHVAAGVILT